MVDSLAETYVLADGGPEYSAAEFRRALAGIFAGPSATRVRSGVRGGNVTRVGTAITIAPLSFALEGQAAPTTQGVYFGGFNAGDAQLSKTLTTAHATLARTDSIWVRQFDPEAVPSESPNHGAVIEYVAGTPGAGTPAAPTPPVNSTTYLLATIFVPINNTAGAVITQAARKPYSLFTGVPMAKARAANNQNLANASNTLMDLASTVYDNDGIINLTANAAVIVTPGAYQVTASCRWNFLATGYRSIGIAVNTAVQRQHIAAAADGGFGSDTEIQVTDTIMLGVGDSVTAILLHASSGAIFSQTDNPDSCGLELHWVGPPVPVT